jgi:hypothetical protein
VSNHLPDAKLQREILRIRDRILDTIATESNFTAVAQAGLLLWLGILKVDDKITNAQAREVALQAIDHYFPREN